jgi:hypothetical protein
LRWREGQWKRLRIQISVRERIILVRGSEFSLKFCFKGEQWRAVIAIAIHWSP